MLFRSALFSSFFQPTRSACLQQHLPVFIPRFPDAADGTYLLSTYRVATPGKAGPQGGGLSQPGVSLLSVPAFPLLAITCLLLRYSTTPFMWHSQGSQGGGRQKSGEQGTPPSTLSRPHLGLSQDPGRLLPRLKRFGGPRSSVPASGHPSLKRSAAANPAAQPGDHPR